jgi:NADH-ubiquinone oxidoreductase chain 6
MNNLYLVYEYYTNGYNIDILSVISVFSILCAIFVIVSKNPIVSVLFLIGLFAGISSYLIIIGLTFIGLSYLIVYIGAVSILFLFILMLINIRISELESNTRNSMLLAINIILLFNYSFSKVLPYNIKMFNSSSYIDSNYEYETASSLNSDNLYYVTGTLWDGNLAEMGHITSIGNIMYTNYNVWLIMASFILLLAMVGAIVITIKPKHEGNKF